MSILRTKTPHYQGEAQPGESPRYPVWAWVMLLMHTPTPSYRQLPVEESKRFDLCEWLMSLVCSATPPYQQPDEYRRKPIAG